ncbi:MAG: pirin family protein [bacterium]|nr:pirin family protein [bacterium]
MSVLIHRADQRGKADHGWLKAAHSFSFANFYNPKLMGFGLIRVFNDDVIAPGRGFDTHPHKNMEIITIPLTGKLAHRDSMGNESVILPGEVQAMSAGKGVRHSEYNASDTDPINLFQIWIMPDKIDIDPRYDQQQFDASLRRNAFQTIVSPLGTDAPGVKVNQTTTFSLADMDSGTTLEYSRYHDNNGLYIMVIEGDVSILNQTLQKRDAIGIQNEKTVLLTATKNSSVLVIDVPMD